MPNKNKEAAMDRLRNDVVKALMDAAQNAVGRDFTDDEKADFRKELERKLAGVCDGYALFPYVDSYGNVRKEFSVQTRAGELTASSCGCESDGIAVTLKPAGTHDEIDVAYAEVKYPELCAAVGERSILPTDIATPSDVCVYTYDNPYTDDYQHSFVLRSKDVMAAVSDCLTADNN